MREYWTKRNKEYLQESRYSTFTFKRLMDKFDIKNKKVIDIGCGYGLMINHLKKNGAEAEGLEICEEVVNNDFKVTYGNTSNIPIEDSTYDFVTSFGTVEHVKEWKQSIKEQFRICKPNGKVMVVVPHILSPVYYIMFLYYIPRMIKYGIRVTTGRPFSKKELVREMNKYGKVTEVKAFDFCCLLEPIFKKLHINLAGFLEKYFGFMGVMIYAVAEKQSDILH